MQGKLNAHGFLSAVGVTPVVNDSGETRPRTSKYYIKRLDSVPCTVLMSIGIGYQDIFSQHANDTSTYFMTWALPCYT